MSNGFLTKRIPLYIYIYMYYSPTNHNTINTNNKLKVIKKSLYKHWNILHDNTKQWLAPLPQQNKNILPLATFKYRQIFQTN